MFCRNCGTGNPDDSKFCESCGTPFSGSAASSSGGGTRSSDASIGLQTLSKKSIIAGNYEVVDVLGEGGMGLVYRARHIRLGHEVAIKVLASNLARDAGLLERFENEGKVQALLRHPHIVAVHDFIRDGSTNGIVMEFIEGMDLEDLIYEHTGPIPDARCVALMMQMLDAIGFAHQNGVVHRDIKPSNIMIANVGGREVVKVMDFGIAKLLSEGGKRTATGTKMGTIHYMSPEQCRGLKSIDHRADIYSLGATLFEMATGRVPFDAESEFELYRSHIELAPPQPSAIYPGVSQAFESVILRSLEKAPEHRFQSAGEFASALAAAVGGGVVAASVMPAHQSYGAPAVQPTAVDAVKAESLCGEAMKLEQANEVEAAYETAKQAMVCNPMSANAQKLIARLQMKTDAVCVGRICSEAAEHYAAGDIASALHLCGQALAAAQQRPDLEDYVEQQASEIVNDRVQQGDALYHANRIEEAIELWQEIYTHLPSSDTVANRLQTAQQRVVELGPAGLKLLEVERQVAEGMYEAASHALEEAAQLGADSNVVDQKRAELRDIKEKFLLELARQHGARSDWEQAVKNLKAAARLGADSGELHTIGEFLVTSIKSEALEACRGMNWAEVDTLVELLEAVGAKDDVVIAEIRQRQAHVAAEVSLRREAYDDALQHLERARSCAETRGSGTGPYLEASERTLVLARRAARDQLLRKGSTILAVAAAVVFVISFTTRCASISSRRTALESSLRAQLVEFDQLRSGVDFNSSVEPLAPELSGYLTKAAESVIPSTKNQIEALGPHELELRVDEAREVNNLLVTLAEGVREPAAAVRHAANTVGAPVFSYDYNRREKSAVQKARHAVEVAVRVGDLERATKAATKLRAVVTTAEAAARRHQGARRA